MNEFSHGVRGQVRMVANISAISQFLPKQLRSFLNQNPLVQIHLEEKISSEIVRAVAEKSADIGIVTIASRAHADLSIYPYKTDRLVVITPVGHPLSQCKEVNYVDTLDYDYVGLHTGSAINNQMLKSAELTGTWEKQLKEIEQGTYKAATFIRNMKQMVDALVYEVRMEERANISHRTAKSPAKAKKKVTGISSEKCPKCKQGTVIKGQKLYGCSAYKEGCDFRMPFSFLDKKISEKQLIRLLKKGRTVRWNNNI